MNHSIFAVVLVTCASALAGCSSSSGGGVNPNTPDAASNASDAGDGGTSPVGDGGGTSGPAACPVWFGPTSVGTKWVYAQDYENIGNHYVGTSTSSVTSSTPTATPPAFELTTVTDTTVSGAAPATQKSTTVSKYECDETGLVLTETSSEIEMTIGDETQSFETGTKYKGNVVLPPTMEAGTKWTASVTITSETNGTAQDPISSTIDYEVVGSSSVTVPAGTFEALEVKIVSTTSGVASDPSSTFYAKGVGQVKSGTGELSEKSF